MVKLFWGLLSDRVMNQEDYIKQRLQDQIDWYDRKSKLNQNWFKRLQVISIIASGSIPFLTGYITDSTGGVKVLVGSLGLVVAVITSVLGLFKFQENWLAYRTTSETLKHEKFLFITNSEPYDQEESFKLLVQRVEGLISKENSSWNKYMKIEKKRN